MKKSVKLTIVLALTMMLCMLFAIFASAETFTVQYKNMNWDGDRDKKSTDENGQITLRDTGYTTDTGSYEITGIDGNKTTVQRQFYGWYDEQGNFYEKGATITLTQNIVLREAFGFEVYTAEDLNKYLGNFFWYTRLGADITATSTIGTQRTGNGNTVALDLNGHSFTSTAEYAFAGQRSGFIITGQGTINHTYTDTKGGLWNSTVHGYGEGQQRLWIGKGVTVNTTGALLHSTSNWIATNSKLLMICGKTTSAYLANTLSVPNKSFEIHEGADVTVTGDALIKNRSTVTDFQTTFYIYGGTLNLPANFDCFTEILRIRYEITGGSYVNPLPDGLLKYGYKCVYNDETGLYDVKLVPCTAEDSEGVHNFIPKESYAGMTSTCEGMGVYYFRCECGEYYVDTLEAVGHSYDILISEDVATCTTKAYKIFKCIRCDATSKVESGNALGHSYTIITIETQATATSSGVKRVTCDRCDDTYTYAYAFDPREQDVTIVVNTADGEKSITIKVSDLYDITLTETASGYTAKINKINTITDPDNAEVTYTFADIIKIVVPTGITDIATDVFKNGTVLTDIILLDGADATFASGAIENCVALERITLGNCTVTFNSNVIDGTTPTNLTIDASKANMTLKGSAFINETGLKKIIMGSYKSYNFGASSLEKVGLEEFIVPDYANLTAAYATFYQAYSLKYVYIGRGITSIDNIFDQCKYLQKIVLMDVTNITGQYFACLADQGEDVLRIYHHASTLSVAGRFLHKSHGVILYTNATGWTGSMDSCSAITKTVGGVDISYPAYTIVKGIPHEYKEGNVDATCTAMGSTGYTTDCPCGAVASATYTTYKGVSAGTSTSNANVSTGEIVLGATIDALGHEFDEADGATVVGTTPAGCGINATITYKCARCDETKTVVQEGTATSHNTEGVEWTITTQPACTTEGFQYKVCTLCNTVAVSEIIPATGHNIEGVEWTKTADATCTLAGTEVKKCTICSVVVESQAIDVLGHISGEFTTVLEPDCDDIGLKEQYCTRCNVLIATETIEKLGHEFDTENGATIFAQTPATCLDNATVVYKCARCNDTNTVVLEDTALGHNFDATNGAVLVGIAYENGFDKAGSISTKCERCAETSDAEAAPLFVAKGYSTNPDGDAINGGYVVDTDLLALYESFNGTITYGVVIANANSFTGDFFVGEAVNSQKAIQVPITMKAYSNFDCTISGFGANSSTLELVICAYVIDAEGNVSFIQAENDYAIATEIGGKSFTKVTLDLVLANVTEQPDALVPTNED